jgi:serine/threonine protein kinase
MDIHDPDWPTVTELTTGADAGNHAESAAEAERKHDRLLTLLEQWEDHYLHHDDASPESLGVEDPTLLEALRQRIDQQMRLYEVLRFASLSEGDETAAVGASPPVPEAAGRDGRQRDEPARRIGRYLVVESLGAGGQGQVFRVVHPELGKEFVLKLARRSLAADPAGRERLLREARLLAVCDHPNLVQVVDLDFHDGRPFIVMEHVHGLNLEQYAEQRRPGPREIARLVAGLARGVAYIHARGIIHQDIKPKNVLIDADGQPKLIDFGLARLRHAWTEDATGSTGGTSSYMSPEQALGQEDRIGPWTDVFGLGGVLHYLLTGRPVYPGAGGFAAFQQACKGEHVSPRQVNPRVPRGLERICLKALAPDPEQRSRKADDLERALRGYLRRPWTVAAGVLVLALAALAFLAPPSRSDRSLPTSGQAGAAPGLVPTVQPAVAPRIVSFEVKHFRGDQPFVSLGTIGVSPEPILFDDSLRVRARLDVPAYCYLIALNPDGQIQLCDPSEEASAPAQTDQITCPLGNKYFPLNDGTGLQAFVLLASRRPLPPFDQWDGRAGLPWKSVQAKDAGVWEFDGGTFEPRDSGRRGQPREGPGAPRPFEEVCKYVAKLPGIHAVRAIAFPVVKPK